MSRATMLDPHLEEENAENIENEVEETQELMQRNLLMPLSRLKTR